MELFSMQTQPMNAATATQIISWKYPDQYSLYNLADNNECRGELLDGTYFSATDDMGELVGFYCFGASAQVPAGMVLGLYCGDGVLDIGLGIKPELCGQGNGLAFLQAGMAWAQQWYQPLGFRLTVAAFNQRAISVYERAGYQKTALFRSAATADVIDFWVMAQQ
jgi:[ribosomal protein S18]-alanine N-acetyltransferase